MKWVTITEYVTEQGEVIEYASTREWKVIKTIRTKHEAEELTKVHIVKIVRRLPYKQLELWKINN